MEAATENIVKGADRVIMEAATEKKKRGRPSIDERTGDTLVKFIAATDAHNNTHRTHANRAYMTAGMTFVAEHRNDIPHHDTLIKPYGDSYVNQKTGIGVLEQLGRMIEQDGYTEADVLHIAVIAADALHKGLKVKEVEQFIRRGRTKGIWKWEAASYNPELTKNEIAGIIAYLKMMQGIYADRSEDAEEPTQLLGYIEKLEHLLANRRS